VAQISLHSKVGVKERPPDFDWQIPLVHRAHGRDGLLNVYRFITELEWNNLRENLEEKVEVKLKVEDENCKILKFLKRKNSQNHH
jgi:hypothetical protein